MLVPWEWGSGTWSESGSASCSARWDGVGEPLGECELDGVGVALGVGLDVEPPVPSRAAGTCALTRRRTGAGPIARPITAGPVARSAAVPGPVPGPVARSAPAGREPPEGVTT